MQRDDERVLRKRMGHHLNSKARSREQTTVSTETLENKVRVVTNHIIPPIHDNGNEGHGHHCKRPRQIGRIAIVWFLKVERLKQLGDRAPRRCQVQHRRRLDRGAAGEQIV